MPVMERNRNAWQNSAIRNAVVVQKVLEITSGRVFFNENSYQIKKKGKRIEINSFVRLNN